MDTGINKNHPALQVKGGISFVTDIVDYDDDNGHGSNCAGIIAARNYADGVVGVAPDASLYAVKILDSSNDGEYEWIIKGLLWCHEQCMHVVSMSVWHQDPAMDAHEVPDEGIQRAAEQVRSGGGVLVGISGNSGTVQNHWVSQPSRCPAIIAVGGVIEDESWWHDLQHNVGSSYGPTDLPEEQAVELVAPASPVYSTWLREEYRAYQGTSQACPHVSGAVALLRQAHPNLSVDEIRARLKATSEDLGPANRDEKFGVGFLNCRAAVLG